MRKFLWLIVILIGLWSGYWFVGARAVEGGLEAWFDQRRSEGWVSEYSSLSTRGFPQRFDTRIVDLELADPRTGVAWSAPDFRISALAYKPNHIIAKWPDNQLLETPVQKIAISSKRMIASIAFEPGTALTLDRFTAELEGMELVSSKGWSSFLGDALFATRQVEGKADTHEIFFETNALRPSGGILEWLDPAGVLPDQFDAFRLDLTAGFDAPWDRFAVERRRPQVTALDITEIKARWGRLDLRAAGKLTVDRAGVPSGRIEIRAENWREMLQVGIDAGVVPANISMTLERALELLAQASGNPKTLEAPLTFRRGRMSFGPIPLGPAPRLILR